MLKEIEFIKALNLQSRNTALLIVLNYVTEIRVAVASLKV